jgi:hypothetical protein
MARLKFKHLQARVGDRVRPSVRKTIGQYVGPSLYYSLDYSSIYEVIAVVGDNYYGVPLVKLRVHEKGPTFDPATHKEVPGCNYLFCNMEAVSLTPATRSEGMLSNDCIDDKTVAIVVDSRGYVVAKISPPEEPKPGNDTVSQTAQVLAVSRFDPAVELRKLVDERVAQLLREDPAETYRVFELTRTGKLPPVAVDWS